MSLLEMMRKGAPACGDGGLGLGVHTCSMGSLAGFGKGLRTAFTPTRSRPGLRGLGYQPRRAETHLLLRLLDWLNLTCG